MAAAPHVTVSATASQTAFTQEIIESAYAVGLTTTAGRFLCASKVVNGNRTSTTVPGLQAVVDGVILIVPHLFKHGLLSLLPVSAFVG